MSAETLALHREGAVSAREAAYVRAHLAACQQCAAVDADLADLPRLLAATPFPAMPPPVLAQIQMSIAGESVARSAADQAADAGTARTSVDNVPGQAPEPAPAQIPGRPDLPARRPRRFPRLRMPSWSSPLVLRGLAAAAVVVLIVGVGMMLANSRTASSNGSAGGAFPQRSPGSRLSAHAAPVNGSAARPLGISYRLRGRIATAMAVVTNANYTRQSLPREVRKDVASYPAMSNVQGSGAPTTNVSPTSLRGTMGVSEMESCLNAVTAGRMVVVTEIARYLGTPAAIIIMRAGSSRVLDVVVAGFACSASHPDIIATLEVPAG